MSTDSRRAGRRDRRHQSRRARARHRCTGDALERLANIDAVALDKTGTLTVGHPAVHELRPAAPYAADTLLALAAAVEHHSGHPLARSVVRAAAERGIAIADASDVHEEPGRGARGRANGHDVAIGSPRWARDLFGDAADAHDGLPAPTPSETSATVVVDGRYAGAIIFADALRPGLQGLLEDLREIGVTRTVLLSGDRSDRVAHIAAELGITDARGDLLPDGKVAAIAAMVAEGHRVAMIGDWVNDAPALSAATVGVALAAHGGGIAAESADCVMLTDDLNAVSRAMRIAHRSIYIARQSIAVGIGLSMVGMGFASAGLLPPVAGAMVQEAIDVAVILNAVRAATAPRSEKTGRREDGKTGS